MPQWIKNFAPDVAATLARFPFAILLSFASTLIIIGLALNVLPTGSEGWLRLGLGLSIAAVFAVAGVLYGESKNQNGPVFRTLAYALPIVAIALKQIESTNWVVAPMLGPISLLWLSVAAFTRVGAGDERFGIQDRFWWLNHRAITTAVIAGVGFGMIALGFIAIERAMSVLFGIKLSRLFYEILLPFTGLFLTPVYWLSTLPKLEDFSPKEISEPDFLSRAIGFLGQFILTPFLFIYALILLAYAVQIGLTGALPQGMLSWMVLGFTIVGAANLLVLHPDFMHTRPLVNYFRKTWFWLTLVPIVLYLIAVWVRIDAYGLTEERVGLIAGGLWIVLLTLAFLFKKIADIRLIPALALIVISIFTLGPWNFLNLPSINQAARLDAAIQNATPATQSTGGPYEWEAGNARIARGAIKYLLRGEERRSRLYSVLSAHGLIIKEPELNATRIFDELELDNSAPSNDLPSFRELQSAASIVSDLSTTPFHFGEVLIFPNRWTNSNQLSFKSENARLLAKAQNGDEVVLDITSWLDGQAEQEITQPLLSFSVAGEDYQLLITHISLSQAQNGEGSWEVQSLGAHLYAQTPPPGN